MAKYKLKSLSAQIGGKVFRKKEGVVFDTEGNFKAFKSEIESAFDSGFFVKLSKKEADNIKQAELKKKKKVLESKIGITENEYLDAVDICAKKEDEIKAAKKTADDLQNAYDKKVKDISGINDAGKKEKAEEQLNGIEKELSESNDALDVLTAELSDLNNISDALSDNLKNLKSELKKL
jgi:chromosome segregation ATPase